MIPSEGLIESVANKEQDLWCHYEPGYSFFVQGVIALWVRSLL
jgi:hypothetical protein